MKIEGMTDALADELVSKYENMIPKSRFDEVNEAKKNADALVKQYEKQLEELKKSSGDNEELKKQIETLQDANKTAKADFEKQIKQMQLDNAINSELLKSGALNTKAVFALLDAGKFKVNDDGSVSGLSEQIKALQESDSYLFKSNEPSKPSGATPAGTGGGTPSGTVTKEQFAKMGYDKRLELLNTNKELYNTLVNEERN